MENPDAARPDTPAEAASYDLKKFRERRITDRRFMPRAGVDRRGSPSDPAPADDKMSPP